MVGLLVIVCVCIGIVCSRLSMGVVWFGCSYLNWNLKQLSRRPFPSFTMSPMWLMVMRIYLYWTRICNKTIWSNCNCPLWLLFDVPLVLYSFICNAIFDCMDEFLCLGYFFLAMGCCCCPFLARLCFVWRQFEAQLRRMFCRLSSVWLSAI